MKPETRKRIGKDLYLISTGMLTMQIVLYLTIQVYLLTPTLIAAILILSGSILRQKP